MFVFSPPLMNHTIKAEKTLPGMYFQSVKMLGIY